MINIFKKPFCLMFKKGTALCVCAAFLITSLPLPQANAEIPFVPTAAYRSLTDDLTAIALPKEIGKIQEIYRGTSDKIVVLIQDAHSIPDAQRSIQSAIHHFQTRYGISLVGLEGASEKLDPQIFRSFPDKKLLRKTFDAYAQKGELTGGTAAAIFSAGQVPDGSVFGGNAALFHGIEDWPLYEEGVSYYLKATELENEITALLEPMAAALNQEKEAIYSRELLDVDRLLASFEENKTDLLQVLNRLSKYQKPAKGSELALLLDEAGSDENNNFSPKPSLEIEVKKIAGQVEVFLKNQLLTSGTRQELQEFSGQFQEFQTSRLTPQAFALYLKSLVKKHKIKVKVSRGLASSVENQKRLKDIEGTRLFEEFKRYADSVKETLIQTTDHRLQTADDRRQTTDAPELGQSHFSRAEIINAIHSLDQKTKDLDLLKRLTRLELSFEDWTKVQKMPLQLDPRMLIPRDGVISRDQILMLLKKMDPHLDFYRIAEKRDQVFLKNTQTLMEKQGKTSSLLVAGGFHTEGLTKTFKEKGISYVLVMPGIGTIPEEPLYREHMQGKVSWSDYFEVKNGKVNLYEAFVRAARDRLLSPQSIDHRPQIKQSALNYGLSTMDYRLAKRWRDQIIRDLAAEGRITHASEYTRFIDEFAVSPQSADHRPQKSTKDFDHGRWTMDHGHFFHRWLANIDRFGDGLKKLQDNGRLSETSIAHLLKTITTAELVTSNALGVNARAEIRLLPWKEKKAYHRSEVRTSAPWVAEAVFRDPHGSRWRYSVVAEKMSAEKAGIFIYKKSMKGWQPYHNLDVSIHVRLRQGVSVREVADQIARDWARKNWGSFDDVVAHIQSMKFKASAESPNAIVTEAAKENLLPFTTPKWNNVTRYKAVSAEGFPQERFKRLIYEGLADFGQVVELGHGHYLDFFHEMRRSGFKGKYTGVDRRIYPHGMMDWPADFQHRNADLYVANNLFTRDAGSHALVTVGSMHHIVEKKEDLKKLVERMNSFPVSVQVHFENPYHQMKEMMNALGWTVVLLTNENNPREIPIEIYFKPAEIPASFTRLLETLQTSPKFTLDKVDSLATETEPVISGIGSARSEQSNVKQVPGTPSSTRAEMRTEPSYFPLHYLHPEAPKALYLSDAPQRDGIGSLMVLAATASGGLMGSPTLFEATEDSQGLQVLQQAGRAYINENHVMPMMPNRMVFPRKTAVPVFESGVAMPAVVHLSGSEREAQDLDQVYKGSHGSLVIKIKRGEPYRVISEYHEGDSVKSLLNQVHSVYPTGSGGLVVLIRDNTRSRLATVLIQNSSDEKLHKPEILDVSGKPVEFSLDTIDGIKNIYAAREGILLLGRFAGNYRFFGNTGRPALIIQKDKTSPFQEVRIFDQSEQEHSMHGSNLDRFFQMPDGRVLILTDVDETFHKSLLIQDKPDEPFLILGEFTNLAGDRTAVKRTNDVMVNSSGEILASVSSGSNSYFVRQTDKESSFKEVSVLDSDGKATKYDSRFGGLFAASTGAFAAHAEVNDKYKLLIEDARGSLKAVESFDSSGEPIRIRHISKIETTTEGLFVVLGSAVPAGTKSLPEDAVFAQREVDGPLFQVETVQNVKGEKLPLGRPLSLYRTSQGGIVIKATHGEKLQKFMSEENPAYVKLVMPQKNEATWKIAAYARDAELDSEGNLWHLQKEGLYRLQFPLSEDPHIAKFQSLPRAEVRTNEPGTSNIGNNRYRVLININEVVYLKSAAESLVRQIIHKFPDGATVAYIPGSGYWAAEFLRMIFKQFHETYPVRFIDAKQSDFFGENTTGNLILLDDSHGSGATFSEYYGFLTKQHGIAMNQIYPAVLYDLVPSVSISPAGTQGDLYSNSKAVDLSNLPDDFTSKMIIGRKVSGKMALQYPSWHNIRLMAKVLQRGEGVFVRAANSLRDYGYSEPQLQNITQELYGNKNSEPETSVNAYLEKNLRPDLELLVEQMKRDGQESRSLLEKPVPGISVRDNVSRAEVRRNVKDLFDDLKIKLDAAGDTRPQEATEEASVFGYASNNVFIRNDRISQYGVEWISYIYHPQGDFISVGISDSKEPKHGIDVLRTAVNSLTLMKARFRGQKIFPNIAVLNAAVDAENKRLRFVVSDVNYSSLISEEEFGPFIEQWFIKESDLATSDETGRDARSEARKVTKDIPFWLSLTDDRIDGASLEELKEWYVKIKRESEGSSFEQRIKKKHKKGINRNQEAPHLYQRVIYEYLLELPKTKKAEALQKRVAQFLKAIREPYSQLEVLAKKEGALYRSGQDGFKELIRIAQVINDGMNKFFHTEYYYKPEGAIRDGIGKAGGLISVEIQIAQRKLSKKTVEDLKEGGIRRLMAAIETLRELNESKDIPLWQLRDYYDGNQFTPAAPRSEARETAVAPLATHGPDTPRPSSAEAQVAERLLLDMEAVNQIDTLSGQSDILWVYPFIGIDLILPYAVSGQVLGIDSYTNLGPQAMDWMQRELQMSDRELYAGLSKFKWLQADALDLEVYRETRERHEGPVTLVLKGFYQHVPLEGRFVEALFADILKDGDRIAILNRNDENYIEAAKLAGFQTLDMRNPPLSSGLDEMTKVFLGDSFWRYYFIDAGLVFLKTANGFSSNPSPAPEKQVLMTLGGNSQSRSESRGFLELDPNVTAVHKMNSSVSPLTPLADKSDSDRSEHRMIPPSIVKSLARSLKPGKDRKAASLTGAQVRVVYEIVIRGEREDLISVLKTLVKALTAPTVTDRSPEAVSPNGAAAEARAAAIKDHQTRILARLDARRADAKSGTSPADTNDGILSIGLMLDAADHHSFLAQFVKVLQESNRKVEVLSDPNLLNDALFREAGADLFKKHPLDKSGFSRNVTALGVNSRIPLGFDPRSRKKETLFADSFQPLSTNTDEIASNDTLMRDHIDWLLAVSLIAMAEITAEPEYAEKLQQKENELKQTIADPVERAAALKLFKADYLKTQLEDIFGIEEKRGGLFKFDDAGALSLIGSVVQGYIATAEAQKSA